MSGVMSGSCVVVSWMAGVWWCYAWFVCSGDMGGSCVVVIWVIRLCGVWMVRVCGVMGGSCVWCYGWFVCVVFG